jgi:hypothetical protein
VAARAPQHAQQQARRGLAALFHHLDPTLDERAAWAVGSFYLALLPGVMAQWLVDPEHAPSGQDLTDALRTIIADIASVDLDTQDRVPAHLVEQTLRPRGLSGHSGT